MPFKMIPQISCIDVLPPALLELTCKQHQSLLGVRHLSVNFIIVIGQVFHTSRVCQLVP